MTDNLDELKKQWQQLAARTEQLEAANKRLSEKLSRGNVTSTQERLAGRISRCSYIGLLLPALAPQLHFLIALPLWYCALYGIFGIIMFILGYRLSSFIREKRLIDMPVSDAIKRAVTIRLRQQHIRIGGFIAVMVLFIVGGCLIPDEYIPATLTGGIAGLVAGLAITIPRIISNERMARSLEKDLRE